MNWISRWRRRSTPEMNHRRHKEKTVKQIRKEIEQLRGEYQKMELRPCNGDLDLIQRDKALDLLKDKIYVLEKERDTYLYTWSNDV